MSFDTRGKALWLHLLGQLNLSKEDRVVWADTTPASFNALCQFMVDGGEIVINQDPNIPGYIFPENRVVLAEFLGRYLDKPVFVRCEELQKEAPQAPPWTARHYFTIRKFALGEAALVGLVLDMAITPFEHSIFIKGCPAPEDHVSVGVLDELLANLSDESANDDIKARITEVRQQISFGEEPDSMLLSLSLIPLGQTAWPKWN